jgi:hypothetical protein
MPDPIRFATKEEVMKFFADAKNLCVISMDSDMIVIKRNVERGRDSSVDKSPSPDNEGVSTPLEKKDVK